MILKDRMIGTADIMERLGCGRTMAQEIMHKFEARGQMYKLNGRLLRIKEKDFENWLEYECRQQSINERIRRIRA